MLRRGKLRKTEVWLIWLIALSLLAAGATGIGLGVIRGEWKLALPGAGVIALGVIYLIAAIRRRPL
jgi:hypothetical protein